MRIAIIGKTGQLANCLATQKGPRDIVFLGRDQLDLANEETIEASLTAVKPDIIINAAAYTDVDQAEEDRDLAFAVNASGVGEAARVAAKLGAAFLHISTDYVFDGSKLGAYVETDPVAPLGVYGLSKEAGEKAIRSVNPRSAIYRTAWVYAPEGKNFVNTVLRLAADRDELMIVGDQRGSPTSATDLAAFVLHASKICAQDKDGAFGTFHVAGSGEASWAEFAEAITQRGAALGLIKKAPIVRHITTSEFPTKAVRPSNSVLNCRKAEMIYDFKMRPWKIALENDLRKILLLKSTASAGTI
jgi:dTDP-4-dehydrorhamnose reductase